MKRCRLCGHWFDPTPSEVSTAQGRYRYRRRVYCGQRCARRVVDALRTCRAERDQLRQALAFATGFSDRTGLE